MPETIAAQKTLETYLRENYEKGVIDHAIRARVDHRGNVRFYIHPHSVTGDTLDFEVSSNSLAPLGREIDD
jgi:hypothetical protein